METNAFLAQLWYYMQQIWHFLAYKLGFAALFAALIEQSQMLVVLFILFLVDFACGFAVAVRLKAVSSSAMRRGMAKGVLYLVFVSTVAITERAVAGTSVATAVAIGILIFTESLSVMENLINLGLPLPFAQKAMRALATKAKLLGIDFHVELNSNSASYVNDVTSMIRVHIPRLQNAELREIMRIYYLNWFDFLRTIDAAVVDTKNELAWERLKASIDKTIANAYESALREGVDRKLAYAFFYDWNAENLRLLSSRAKRHVHNCDVAAEIIDNVEMNIATMLYQTLNRSAIWDRTLHQGNGLPHGPAVQDLPGCESGAYPVIVRNPSTSKQYRADGTTAAQSSGSAPLEPDSGEYQALDIDALEPLDGSGKRPPTDSWTDFDRNRPTRRMDNEDDDQTPLINT